MFAKYSKNALGKTERSNTKWTISRETGNIGYTERRKQNKNTT